MVLYGGSMKTKERYARGKLLMIHRKINDIHIEDLADRTGGRRCVSSLRNFEAGWRDLPLLLAAELVAVEGLDIAKLLSAAQLRDAQIIASALEESSRRKGE